MYIFLKNGVQINLYETISESTEKTSNSYLVSCYLTNIDPNTFDRSKLLCELVNSKLLILNVDYFEYPGDAAKQLNDRGINLKGTIGVNETAESGIYLFIIFNESLKQDESREEALAALIALVKGRNFIYKNIFKRVSLAKDFLISESSTIDLDIVYETVEFSENNISTLRMIQHKLHEQKENVKNRYSTSLRWYYKSLSQENIIDKFISIWIAIETVSKAEGSDIKPINETLQKIYDFNKEQVRRIFQVGDVYGLRSAIVHNGKNPSIELNFIRYLEALYLDLLCFNLELNFMKSSLKIKKASKIDVSSFSVKQSWSKGK